MELSRLILSADQRFGKKQNYLFEDLAGIYTKTVNLLYLQFV